MLSAWNDVYDATCGPTGVQGNIADPEWRPRSPFSMYVVLLGAYTAALLYCVPVGPWTTTLLCLAGFVYINHAVTARPTMLRGRTGGYSDAALVLFAAPVLHWASPLALEGANSPLCKACMWFGFVFGVNLLFLSRRWSALAASAVSGGDPALHKSMRTKAAVAAFGMTIHLSWCATLPAWWAALRVAAYVSLLVVVPALTTRLKNAGYYLHLHHYLLGIMFVPTCFMPLLPLSVLLASFSISQFVEGASRWSAAPLWHRRK